MTEKEREKREAALHRRLMPLWTAAAGILGRNWRRDCAEELNTLPFCITEMWQGRRIIYYEDALKIEALLLARCKSVFKAYDIYFGDDRLIKDWKTERALEWAQMSFDDNTPPSLHNIDAKSSFEATDDFGVSSLYPNGLSYLTDSPYNRQEFEELGWVKN